MRSHRPTHSGSGNRLSRDRGPLARESPRRVPRAPGAKECRLDDAVYECEWVVESPAKGIQEFEAFAGSLATCLKSKGFDIDHQPGLFQAVRRGIASVVASWSREFLTINLQVAKE
jgi:hypothetical protein